MSWESETLAYAADRVRARMRKPEPEPPPDFEPVELQPELEHRAVVEQVALPQPPACPTVDVAINPSEVPAGETVHETVESALAALRSQAVPAAAKSSLAAFARARLRALLLDPSVRDQTLVQAAKALLRDNPERQGPAECAQTIFVMPLNDKGPLPHAPIYLRTTALWPTGPTSA